MHSWPRRKSGKDTAPVLAPQARPLASGFGDLETVASSSCGSPGRGQARLDFARRARPCTRGTLPLAALVLLVACGNASERATIASPSSVTNVAPSTNQSAPSTAVRSSSSTSGSIPHTPTATELRFQDEITSHLEALKGVVGASYGGSYFSPGTDGDGHFTLLLADYAGSDDEVLRAWPVADWARERVSIERVQHSFGDLNSIFDVVHAALYANNIPAEQALDEPQNCIDVHVLKGHLDEAKQALPADVRNYICWSEGELGGLL